MGKLSRDKGKSFERETAKAFRALYPSAKRTLTQQRDSGEAPDIEIPEWWVGKRGEGRRGELQATAAALHYRPPAAPAR